MFDWWVRVLVRVAVYYGVVNYDIIDVHRCRWWRRRLAW
jgi:hypothetical protein